MNWNFTIKQYLIQKKIYDFLWAQFLGGVLALIIFLVQKIFNFQILCFAGESGLYISAVW